MKTYEFAPLIVLGGIGFSALLATGLYVDSRNDYLYNQAYRKAEAIADVSKDGITTEKEWQAAYQKAGINRTFRMWINRDRPNSLIISQLEKIIETN